MQIQLFMANFTHDRIERPGDGSRAVAGWIHGGMQKPPLMAFAEAISAEMGGGRIPHLLLRKEAWGGLVFDSKSQAVYEADEEAFVIFNRLKTGESIEEIKSSGASGVDHFIEMTHKLELVHGEAF
jgi:hypothetical protein